MAEPNQTVSAATPATSFEQYLNEHGLLSGPVFQRLQEESTKQGVAFVMEDWLISQKIFEEEELTKIKADFFNLPYADLRKVSMPTDAFEYIPKESVQFYNLAPFETAAGVLKVAITDPTNLQALQALEFVGQKKGVQVQLFLASTTSVDVLTGKRKNLTSVVGQAL